MNIIFFDVRTEGNKTVLVFNREHFKDFLLWLSILAFDYFLVYVLRV